MATRGDRPLPVERRHKRQPRAHDGRIERVPDDERVRAALDFLRGLVATLEEPTPDTAVLPRSRLAEIAAVRTRAVLAAEEAAAAWKSVTTTADLLEAVQDELDEYATVAPSQDHGRSLKARLMKLEPSFRGLLPEALPDLIRRWQVARFRTRGRPKAGAPPVQSTTEILHELLVSVGLTTATPESLRRARRRSK
ncbi:MAG: hypothetical protein U0414_42545 [Polyangiaceae bacterium]